MSDSRSDTLKQANEILSLIKNENIEKPIYKSHPQATKLQKCRELCMESASKMPVPGLTSCVAVTLLGVGLCQELAQRYVLEYAIKYKKQNISLFFLGNPKNADTKEYHTVVIIGPVKAPENLIVNNSSIINPVNSNQPIDEFLKNNANCIIADPLYNCVGDELTPLMEYCKQNDVTHVVGVRSYHNTPNFVQSVEKIKLNACKVAEEVKPQLLEKPIQKNNTNASSTTLFENDELKQLIKKYQLTDQLQASLEKGLRNAATNNKIEDLKIFIKYVKNVNAKDTNEKIKRTALHWAALKGHKECYNLLLQAGANADTTDAAGYSSTHYLNAFESKPVIKNEKK